MTGTMAHLHQKIGGTGDIQSVVCTIKAVAASSVGHLLAWEWLEIFLQAKFSGAERHQCRLAEVAELEHKGARA